MESKTQKPRMLVFGSILIVIAIITGILIHQGGKPYDTLFFTFHKLAALIAVVTTIIKIKKNKMIQNSSKGIRIGFILLITCLVTLFITGALLSVNSGPYQIVLAIHNISTGLILADSIYLLIAFRKMKADQTS